LPSRSTLILSQIAKNFFHAVRDVHQRDAARFQPKHDLEERLNLAMRERGGRLVHHQHAGVE
jgi:hypothetical protein